MYTTLSLDSRYDNLLVSIHQIEALLDVATSADFSELKPEIVSNYLWIIRDIVSTAKLSCESLANIPLYSQPAAEDKNHAN